MVDLVKVEVCLLHYMAFSFVFFALIQYISNDLSSSSDFTATMVTIFFVLRSEEHTSELQSLMRISYAVFCFKKKTINITLLFCFLFLLSFFFNYTATTEIYTY